LAWLIGLTLHKGSLLFVYIKLFLAAVFWGGTFIAGRVVAKDVGPFAASFLRFAIASVFLLFITWRVDGKLPAIKKAQIIPIILLGMTGVFAYNVLFFKGLKIIEAGRASLIIANNPIFITLFASCLIFTGWDNICHLRRLLDEYRSFGSQKN
jgi:drug/metabolite transporter (DMT)-like permease